MRDFGIFMHVHCIYKVSQLAVVKGIESRLELHVICKACFEGKAVVSLLLIYMYVIA